MRRHAHIHDRWNAPRELRTRDAKCSGQMRYCHTCAIERRVKAKALKVFGIPPEKISVTVVGGAVRPPCTTHKALGLDNGVYFTSKAALDVVRGQTADIVTMNPPLSTGGDCAKLREACAKAAESAAEIMERVRHKDGLAFNTANYIAGVARTALAATEKEGGAK